ncbi:MAG: phosphatidylserine decarboxylase family protein [Deltaproteobacteria bacterium]|nr:phosphatidylserine decarboxylase family protein [Deltaproteobacteria bacterium]MBW1966228.1 phosphatidylserine decarboxylase family protein [Deltaproteobacteria bacterium]MBW2097225.1 phosphatidylserine decarboxylase family protein [Deltaproteobacteria bacterium]
MHSHRIPIAREGTPFIGGAVLAAVVFASLNWSVTAIVFFVIAGFVLFFFRDPERIIPSGPGLVVSPADGRVIDVAEDDRDSLGGKDVRRISIFMSIFNVHVNRVPITGQVRQISYWPGSFWPADRKRALLENERNAILICGEDGIKLTVVQVAGIIARRISCWVKAGDNVKIGERFGLIRFGSRLDVYVPKTVSVLVKKGDRTRAGQTVLARNGSN